MTSAIHVGDCRDIMRGMEAESFHAVVSDPPYGLGFMGRGWDRGVPGPEFWAEALRVAKPGAHLVAFGGTRTYHRLACAIEDAGWELRDCACWLYASGFPKSHDVSKALDKTAGAQREVVGQPRSAPMVGVFKHDGDGREQDPAKYAGAYKITAPATDAAREWDGFGTALKPAWEPIILARKPLTGTIAENVQAHGCGALNIAGCRVDGGERLARDARARTTLSQFGAMGGSVAVGTTSEGRWPANLLLHCECEGEHDPDCAVAMLDAQSGELQSASSRSRPAYDATSYHAPHGAGLHDCAYAGEAGGASRFFFTSKASRSERERGLEHRQQRVVHDGRKTSIDNPYLRAETKRGNTHPTVKPVSLMRWLVRLVGGKRGSLVLDPFCGSGSTGVACELEGFSFAGIDLDPDHCAIARARILSAAEEAGTATAEHIDTVPERQGPVQLGLLETTR